MNRNKISQITYRNRLKTGEYLTFLLNIPLLYANNGGDV